jgi:gamma-glutamyl phosphate reductase
VGRVQNEDGIFSPTSRSSSQKVHKIHSMKDMAEEASAASAALAQQPAEHRTKILLSVAAAMEARKDEIMMANQMDIASFRAQSALSVLMHSLPI